jgi:Collagen triple helix repeat (20 copies)
MSDHVGILDALVRLDVIARRLVALEAQPLARDGRDGVPGRDGQSGREGERGPAGERGEAGPVGPTGAAGGPGEPGERGEKGDPGIPGPDGVPGIQGLPGEPGPAGERGEPGPAGQDAYPGRACGLYDAQMEFRALDVVTFNGSEWRARCDNPGPLPGDGWLLGAKKGEPGKPGPRGPAGERGEAGPPGTGIDAITFEDWSLVFTLSDGVVKICDLRPIFERYDAERR